MHTIYSRLRLQVLFPAQTGSCCKSTASGFFMPSKNLKIPQKSLNSVKFDSFFRNCLLIMSSCNSVSPDLSEKADSEKITTLDGSYWGQELKKARKKAGFSQKMLGDLIGKSNATISLMEKGKVSEETARYALDLLEKYLI